MNILRYILLLTTFSSLTSFAADYYINDNSTAGDIFCTAVGNNANDGLTPATPKSTLEAILDAYGPSGSNILTSGDTIFIDAGLYTTDHDLVINIAGLVIKGAGYDATIIDNEYASADANHFATITADGVVLEDLFLTEFNELSGATVLHISGAQNVIIKNVFSNNNKPGTGGATIVVDGGSHVTFNGGGASCNPGHSSMYGGGMGIIGPNNTVFINNYSFNNNYREDAPGSAVRINGNSTTTVTITNTSFDGNENASGFGGAVAVYNGATLNLSASCFSNNTVNRASNPNYGGSVFIGGGSTATIDNCTFMNSTASPTGNGGAVAVNADYGLNNDAYLTLSNSSFTNNNAYQGNDINGRGSSGNRPYFTITECSWTGGSVDLRDDDGFSIFSISNSGSPSNFGISAGEFTNNTPSSVTPTTFCQVTPPDPCGVAILLPVELIAFNGKCTESGNRIEWSTYTEINNQEFILEKSVDNQTFSTLGIIPGAGNSSHTLNYAFVDTETRNSTNYYRLSQIDYDGTREYFSTIAVENNCSDDQMSVYYDRGNSSLVLNNKLNNAEISLLDLSGKQALSVKHYNCEKNGRLNLPSSLSSGIYILQIIHGEKIETSKIYLSF